MVAFLIKFLFCCIIEVTLLESTESPLPSTLLDFMVCLKTQEISIASSSLCSSLQKEAFVVQDRRPAAVLSHDQFQISTVYKREIKKLRLRTLKLFLYLDFIILYLRRIPTTFLSL
jgi:hypothetical protein